MFIAYYNFRKELDFKVEIIELKHHDSFNLPEPGFVKKCKENIEKYYQDYYDVLNSLTSLEQNAEGVLLLCGKDFLTEKLSELESEIREVTTVCDSIHRMKLYDMTVEKRNEILNDVKNKILAEKNNAISQKNNAQKKINSRSWLVWNSEYDSLCSTVNESNKTIKNCDEDLDIIDKLGGKDYNEY